MRIPYKSLGNDKGLKPTAKFRRRDAAEEYMKSTRKADFTYFPSAENNPRFGGYFSKSK
jgi:hypothetical protein